MGPALRPLRILLAEDNEVNQCLMMRLLSRRGHAVLVAGDGAEAVAALAQETFDLVLMDVQMPTMNGFEATAAIRTREQATGGHVPIVALTANAMKGDRERCLAAGFDDYLSKPVQTQELFALIEGLLSPTAPAPRQDEDREPPDEALVDRAALLERVDGDLDLLRELVGVFLADYPRLLEALHGAVTQGDAGQLKRTAHTLKGAVSNFASAACVARVQHLEALAEAKDLVAAANALPALEAQLGHLCEALRRCVQEGSGTRAAPPSPDPRGPCSTELALPGVVAAPLAG